LNRFANPKALFVVVALGACGPPPGSALPPSAPHAEATAPQGTSAPSNDAPPPVEPGERPSVACAAKHPIVALPLSAVQVDDWASAMAGYKPEANGGRPVAWEGAEGDVKAYLEGVHACVHEAFVDSFLKSLAGLPKDHALADPELATTVELVIDGESGALVSSGVVSSSGVAELDAAALAAFGRAFPLEPPPPALLSSDGRFYVTWELHRRRSEACSPASARAWKLRF
jgi:hypothetical protein